MALLEILETPDPRLRTVAKPVETFDEKLARLADDMIETMYAARGIGLAAHFTFGGYAAHAMEVTVAGGKLTIERIVADEFDLRPYFIIKELELIQPMYLPLASYGHMGREDLGVRWEDTDRVEALRAAAGL